MAAPKRAEVNEVLRIEKARLADSNKGIRETIKQLDRTNVLILDAMWKSGPRNLLEVSRRTRIPFTSVYHRVAKLEAKSNRVATLIPQVAGLGLVRVVVLASARPGCEEKVTVALKLPNYSRSVNRCEGLFTHFSVQLVPFKHLKLFARYVKRLQELRLTSKSSIIQTGEYVPNFPDFHYYSPKANQWTFEWAHWLSVLRKKPTETITDPIGYSILVDRKDMLIIRELEKNARKSFAELSPILGISLQGVKYHYDKKLIQTGIVKHFAFDILPFPEEISAHHEILLNFKNGAEMNRFYSLIPELIFVLGTSKALRRNSLLIRTYTLQTQVQNLFAFLSEIAREGRIEDYSAIRQISFERDVRMIPYELYDEDDGWSFDIRKYLAELSKLARSTSRSQ